jgi:CPA1 family monovalent cation:H+ antiporter
MPHNGMPHPVGELAPERSDEGDVLSNIKVELAGVMSVPMLMGASAFPERDLLIFIAAGVILLSLIAASIALPLLLRGIEASPYDKRRNEVRDAWRKTAEAAIHALET